MLFDLTISISDRFPALSPFDIRREKAHEVFILVNRLNDAESRKTEREKRSKTKAGIKRKPAGDSWF